MQDFSLYFTYKKKVLTVDGQQFHQYQQSPLILTHWKHQKKREKELNVWRCKSRSWFGTGIKNVAGLNRLMGSQLSLLLGLQWQYIQSNLPMSSPLLSYSQTFPCLHLY